MLYMGTSAYFCFHILCNDNTTSDIYGSTKKTQTQDIKWAFKISVHPHFLLPSTGWLWFFHKQGFPERWLQQSPAVHCFNPYIPSPPIGSSVKYLLSEAIVK